MATELSLGLVHKSMKYGQSSASQAYCGSAGHAVITRYVLMTVLAAARCLYREGNGPEAEMTNDPM